MTDRVLADRPQRQEQSPHLPARERDAVGHPRGLGAGPPHRGVRRLAARHEDGRRRPRRACARSPIRRPAHAAPDDAGELFVCDTNFSGSRTAHLPPRRRSGRRGAAALRQRGVVRRQALGRAVSRTTTGRSRSKPRSTPTRIRALRRTIPRVVFTSDKTRPRADLMRRSNGRIRRRTTR